MVVKGRADQSRFASPAVVNELSAVTYQVALATMINDPLNLPCGLVNTTLIIQLCNFLSTFEWCQLLYIILEEGMPLVKIAYCPSTVTVNGEDARFPGDILAILRGSILRRQYQS